MRKFLLILGVLSVLGLKANNITVTNVALAGQNVSAGVNNAANFTYIEFDLAWDNSWRTSSSPVNWDAAWVFVKYRTVGSSVWNHVKLAPSGHNSSGTGTSYSVQVGLTDESIAHSATTNPAVGAIIYRSANGTGSFSASDIRLKWFYRDNGVGDNDIIDVDVYAVEMVYVPDGSFWVGDNGLSGGGGAASFSQFVKSTSGGSTSYDITSESAINYSYWGSANFGNLYGININSTGTIAGAYPKGYNGFYCMKYECTQQQYVDFLNALTSSQQTNRAPSGSSGRQNITLSGGIYSTTTPSVPAVSLSWMDLAGYLDWAGMRPMTEFEFEKACRGTSTVVTGEYAWGNTSTTLHAGLFSGSTGGTASEVSAVSGANMFQFGNTASATYGPIRVGAFANNASTRSSAGASFYGIMELSGNLQEFVVSFNAAYTGLHGNGVLTSAGHGDVTSWPGLTSGAITGGTGSGYRGGSYLGTIYMCQTADRTNATTAVTTKDYTIGVGIRGLHTKPSSTAETK